MEGALRPLFIFQDNGKTNKSIAMPDPNFLLKAAQAGYLYVGHMNARFGDRESASHDFAVMGLIDTEESPHHER